MNYIEKIYADKAVGVRISVFTGSGGTTEYQAMFTVLDGTAMFSQQLEHIQEAYEEVVKSELLTDAVPLFRRYFLSDAANQSDLVMVWECENSFCALSIVEQAPLNGSKVAMWTWFRTKALVDTHKNGLLLASHNGYTHCWLGGAHNRASNSEYQTRLLLNDYIMQLTEGMCRLSKNCIRTWFFVQNIDVNYSGVVRARKDVFVTQGLTEKTHYIASTGIEGRHADPSILVQMDAYSIKGIQSEQVRFLYAPTHLNPTYEYGVTFERGTVVQYGDCRQLFISGTASIDNRGEIVHKGDIVKQTERMLENISVLLAEGGATMQDVSQAIVYLRDIGDYGNVQKIFKERGFNFPYLLVHAPVCRPGWLIEMECIALVADNETTFLPL